MPKQGNDDYVYDKQVMDSGEQGLFGDLQTSVSTIAMTTTSSSLAPPNDSRHGHHQVSIFVEVSASIRLSPSVSPVASSVFSSFSLLLSLSSVPLLSTSLPLSFSLALSFSELKNKLRIGFSKVIIDTSELK